METHLSTALLLRRPITMTTPSIPTPASTSPTTSTPSTTTSSPSSSPSPSPSPSSGDGEPAARSDDRDVHEVMEVGDRRRALTLIMRRYGDAVFRYCCELIRDEAV